MILKKRDKEIAAVLLTALLLIIVLAYMIKCGTVMAQGLKKTIIIRPIRGEYNKIVTPGKENTLHIEIHNIGDIPITDLKLSTEPRNGWKIDVDPVIIDNLNAGSIQTVTVRIVPARNAGRDRYLIKITADSNDIKRVTNFYVRIDAANSIWTWIGVGIVLVVIVGFACIFKYYNRQ